MFSSASSQ